MSLYVVIANVAITLISSLLTWISYLWMPDWFAYFALTASASVLVGTLYLAVLYISILFRISYLK